MQTHVGDKEVKANTISDKKNSSTHAGNCGILLQLTMRAIYEKRSH